MRRIVDWPAEMRALAEFVGLDEGQLQLIRDTREQVLAHGEALTAAVYDHFLQFPYSRRFFTDETGEVDAPQLERRKASLLRWLRGSIDFQIDEDYPIPLLAMGVVHRHPAAHRAQLGPIPAGLMIGSMSFIQSELAGRLAQEMEAGAALQASTAWNRMLMVQLYIMLAGYLTEPASEPPGHPQTENAGGGLPGDDAAAPGNADSGQPGKAAAAANTDGGPPGNQP